MKKVFLTALVLSAFCAFSLAQERKAKEIKITSGWGGLGTPQNSELIITRKSKGYYAGGNRVESRLVDNLLKAVEEPEIKQIEAANLGITREWLNASAEIGVEEYASVYYRAAAPNQRELYLSSFKDPQFIEKILPSALSGGWTDDNPRVAVEVTGSDGSKTIIFSNEQPLFMLPWKITRNAKTVNTYNANISRAIVALLPRKFANRDRLSGDSLRRVLAQSVMRRIENEWRLLEAENKAGDVMSKLKETYTVISAEVNPYHGVDFGEEWENNRNPEKNLHLILKKDDFPAGFAIALKLPFRNEKVESPALFLDKIKQYQDLIFSVPWLKNLLETKKSYLELRFIKNRSFSEKAMKKFAEDMSGIGKSELIAEVASERENIALIGVGGGLEYYQSYWLVLPGKKVILWRYRYPLLLNWSEKDFELKECTDKISAGLKCAGAVISPDGDIISK